LAAAWSRDLIRQQRECERELRRSLRQKRGIPADLRRAMAHSLFGGGKRLRPVLAVWCCDAFSTDPAHRALALRAGSALEMIHTYSLIHDDLPAMDDDVLRRGRPTCHVMFGEGAAILAGDALQALAFEILAGCGPEGGRLVATVAHAAGPAGMVGGQQDDLASEHLPVTAALVRRIHIRKTAALIAASLETGAVVAGAAPRAVAALGEAGRQLGLAFQAADDVLDVTSTAERLGKSVGKDQAAAKATWVRAEGLPAATARIRRYGEKGLDLLTAALPAGPAALRLVDLGRIMWSRDR
jgi:geranylgeranyl diphosphate synthase, type II